MVVQLVRIPLQCRRPQFNSWVGKFPWRRHRLPTPVFLGFPDDSDGKESACNVGDMGSIPGLGRSPGGGHGNPLQYSCLENPHGQRNLAGYSPMSHRVRYYWVTKLKHIANYQCCDSFRKIVKGFSHTHICIHSPPNTPSIQANIKINLKIKM